MKRSTQCHSPALVLSVFSISWWRMERAKKGPKHVLNGPPLMWHFQVMWLLRAKGQQCKVSTSLYLSHAYKLTRHSRSRGAGCGSACCLWTHWQVTARAEGQSPKLSKTSPSPDPLSFTIVLKCCFYQSAVKRFALSRGAVAGPQCLLITRQSWNQTAST